MKFEYINSLCVFELLQKKEARRFLVFESLSYLNDIAKPRGLFLRIFLWEQRETKTGECTMMITHAKRAVYPKSRLFVSPARHSAVCDIEYRGILRIHSAMICCGLI